MKGFTLIELLVVISILGILVVAFLPELVSASEEEKRVQTEARIEMLASAIDAYERQHGHYPPDNFLDPTGKLSIKADAAGINAGIESAMIFLHQVPGGSDFSDRQDWLGNTDQDVNGAVIPRLGRSDRPELLDGWGNPLVYFCDWTGGMARDQKVMMDGDVTVTARAWKNPAGGGYLGQRRYQIVSAGPDMIFNTDDDITKPPRY